MQMLQQGQGSLHSPRSLPFPQRRSEESQDMPVGPSRRWSTNRTA